MVARTTVDIEASVLRELKRLQKREGKSLGQLISELVAAALAYEEEVPQEGRPFRWTSRPMGARVNLQDKEAVRAALDAS